jgi:hypothetical protein
MKMYVGFDDTDHRGSRYGTGKLVRWFRKALPPGWTCIGVVRQQLLVCSGIPFTSHNSAACMVVDMPEDRQVDGLIQLAVEHIRQFALEGSDPGLCVADERCRSLPDLIRLGAFCTHAIASQGQAIEAARYAHLSGHGGTCDGIIGAAAAVGLTASGWSGRFIEFGNLRDYPEVVMVSDLGKDGIRVMSMDRDGQVPGPDDKVYTHCWLRPRLMGNQAVMLVKAKGRGEWENLHFKRVNSHGAGNSAGFPG